jgi:hypothetical protein
VRDVPDGYLEWCLRECGCLEPWLRQAIRDELTSRGVEAEEAPRPGRYPPPADMRMVVKTWFAQLSMKYHPDRFGGDGREMKVVNEAHEKLRELLGVTT